MENHLNNQRNLQLLTKAFSKKVIVELAKKNNSPTLNSILQELGMAAETYRNKPLSSFFESSYKVLLKHYRSEYVFKNAIAEKIVRGRHRLANTCFLTEFRVSNSIADAVVFNGTSTAYEIKTEFDSFDRLDSQLRAYTKVFENTYVVIPETSISKLSSKIPDHIGIYCLSEKYSLSKISEPVSQLHNLCNMEIMSCLRPSEYLSILQKKFQYEPKSISPSQTKSECKELFNSLSSEEAHQGFLEAIKSRQLDSDQIAALKHLPKSLTSVLLTSKLTAKNMLNFSQVIS